MAAQKVGHPKWLASENRRILIYKLVTIYSNTMTNSRSYYVIFVYSQTVPYAAALLITQCFEDL